MNAQYNRMVRPPISPAGSQCSRPRGGSPNVAIAHGTNISSAKISYDFDASEKHSSTGRVRARAIGPGTSRRQSMYPAITAKDTVIASAGPSSFQAGTLISAEVRPTSQGNSGG